MPPRGGRKPKPEAERRNKSLPRHDWIEVDDVPFEGAPELPRDTIWPAWTLRWWEAVSRLPHCVLWDAGDWEFALQTALVAKAFHEGDQQRAGELRLREKILGTTWDFRRDLRIRYVLAGSGEAEAAGVTAIAAYRERIAKGKR